MSNGGFAGWFEVRNSTLHETPIRTLAARFGISYDHALAEAGGSRRAAACWPCPEQKGLESWQMAPGTSQICGISFTFPGESVLSFERRKKIPMTQESARLLRASEGEVNGAPGGPQDRFMIDGKDTQGRFALVQHLFPPRALAAPMHLHRREDEYTYVLNGRIGAILGGDELFAEPGDLIFKPREQWHTFWNAGDEPAAVLEVISAAGLEKLFRELGRLDVEPDPQTLAAMAARYGCDVDFEATFPLVERHGLQF